jgi:hypothetical protein
MATNFSNKAGILADLWINFRDQEEFADFIEYNDIGLPLAYYIHTEIVLPTQQAELYVEETFNLLCAALDLDLDGDYETLNEMFDKSQNQ